MRFSAAYMIRVLVAAGVGLVFQANSTAQLACADGQGSWLDQWSGVWYVENTGTMTGQNQPMVSGSYRTTACGVQVVYRLSGYHNPQNGQLNLVASSPNPSSIGGCSPAPNISYAPYVAQRGCDTASGMWHNTFGYSSTLRISKACSIPFYEATPNPTDPSSYQYWDYQPGRQTIFVWAPLLPASGTTSWGGRWVTESTPRAGVDGCYVASQDEGKVRVWNRVDGTTWQVGNSAPNSYQDGIGYDQTAVSYYRSQRRPDCESRFDQVLSMTCSGGPVTYHSQSIGGKIGLTTVESRRGGKVANKQWP